MESMEASQRIIVSFHRLWKLVHSGCIAVTLAEITGSNTIEKSMVIALSYHFRCEILNPGVSRVVAASQLVDSFSNITIRRPDSPFKVLTQESASGSQKTLKYTFYFLVKDFQRPQPSFLSRY